MSIWDEHLQIAKALPVLSSAVSDAVDLIYSSLAAGGQLLIVGNGRSAADAQHIAAELTGRFRRERRPLPAMALHANTSALSAIGNDYGYEHVFARELSAHARPGDVLLTISTSGDSRKFLRTIEAARESSGREMRAACDLCVCPIQNSSARSGNAHHHRPYGL
jgi:D-sedoheptulose 7-phosphate isomerase